MALLTKFLSVKGKLRRELVFWKKSIWLIFMYNPSSSPRVKKFGGILSK
jgi:hypothetical protein